jgi:hypothetical protein
MALMLLPLARAAAVIVGRPSRVPAAFVLASPALTLSRIMDRSNSANTPIIWNSALPLGVVVSTCC